MILSVIAYSLLLISGVVYCLPALTFFLFYALFNFYRSLYISRMMRYLIRGFAFVLVRFALRGIVKVETEYEDGEEKVCPAIYICNHRSASDALFVSEIRTEKIAFMVMKSWPMRLPFLGLCAKIAGFFSITDHSYEEILAKCRQLLICEGTPVFVYPEGTRSGDRHIKQFHGTFFRIAKELDLPIVPVAIAGNEKIPDLNFIWHRGRVKMRVLKSIPSCQVRQMPLFALKNLVRNRLMEETHLLDERLDKNER